MNEVGGQDMVHVVFRFCLLYWYSCMLGEENAKSSIEGFGGGGGLFKYEKDNQAYYCCLLD